MPNSVILRKLKNQYLEVLSRINDDHVLSVLEDTTEKHL